MKNLRNFIDDGRRRGVKELSGNSRSMFHRQCKRDPCSTKHVVLRRATFFRETSIYLGWSANEQKDHSNAG